MPHYMLQGRYTANAINAMVETPQDREASAKKLFDAAGIKMLAFYFCFGREDVLCIVDAPDDQTMASCLLTLGASGAFGCMATTHLMTSSEAMGAMQKAQSLRASYTAATG
ncbi:GYD domain-containing protein [Aestuariicoccus sp. MJ-SS9]|uniref:GYD domain-containing protein n=1 Tax=Aestuariicoccus sp. MJ-SS9 TaxID=3079855 RepID=UPI002910C61C|nr:GYD domain-containing protein [Aestuariicoccus sp. MJ-SS9]MDU8910337.1 GYD domain-containing protein [Aestuariicoccus sp. MJ-SS9]